MTKSYFGKIAYIFFGVLLPVVALIVEGISGVCAAEMRFDPIPTVLHVIAVTLVPLVFLTLTLAKRANNCDSPIWRFSVGLVTGISVVYSIPFFAYVPIAIVGAGIVIGVSVIFAIPLLPLMPFIFAIVGVGLLLIAAFSSAVVGFFSSYKMSESNGFQGWWGSVGMMAALMLLTAMVYPRIVGDRAMDKLYSGDERDRLDAIQLLRKFDPEAIKSRLCQHQRVLPPNPISPLLFVRQYSKTKISPELFWQATGTMCDASVHAEWLAFERDVLSFSSSRVDNFVDGEGTMAHTEWLYEVENSDIYEREADFIVQLPAGGVVSRVALWEHGKPREASTVAVGPAAGPASEVLSRHSSRLSVTTVGPDRIHVRMLLKPNHTARAQIDIIQPALLDENGSPTFGSPHVSYGNVANKIAHHVRVEAPHKILGRGNSVANKRGFESHVHADQPLVQRIRLFEPSRIKNLIVVLDGGLGMADSKVQIGEVLNDLNFDQLTLIVAGDFVEVPIKQASPENASKLLNHFFSDFEFVGGRDNVDALMKAVDIAAPDAVTVWIHAGQTHTFKDHLLVSELEGTKIFELQVDAIEDVNVQMLHASGVLEAIPRRGTPAADLSVWLKRYHEPTWRIARELTPDVPFAGGERQQLSQIAANTLVVELIRRGHYDTAFEVASEFKIITPVSAAIVRETQM